MATRNVTYQFTWGYATYDRNTEADRIVEIESTGDYIGKFDVTIPEREKIDEGLVSLEVVNDELILTDVWNVDVMLASNWPGAS